MAEYSQPVAQFLTLGEPDWQEWDDYLKMGFGPEHVPELIRMATDPELNEGDSESSLVWAPVHAWRTLGQLRAAEAVEPLLRLLQQEEERDSDLGLEDLPRTLGQMGPPALAQLTAYLADESHGRYSRGAVARAMKEMAQLYPAAREACITALVQQLEQSGKDHSELNGFLVADLLDLKALEAAPALERAFAEDKVEESIAGDWPWVRYELGLGPKPPPRRFVNLPGFDLPGGSTHTPRARAKERAKAKRKQAKQSRKRNRKKK
jgi:hypothetical protein